jgi:NAD(P)-dependent dehydrogenase (short-subunit alcohol dehydrogenase family)
VNYSHSSAVVTGGASGLGLATVRRLLQQGMHVVIADLSASNGSAIADELGSQVQFVPADVTSETQMQEVIATATHRAPLRALVHCAGRGGALRILDKEGKAGSQEFYENIVRINLFGTFNTLRLAAEAMARNEPVEGDRGVCVLTSSVAAWEGQVGQIPYASAKAGIAGMTIVAARDLAQRAIRVVTVAPGIFDTPILARLPENVRASLAASIPHPSRLGQPDEFARLALHIIDNPMLNGETIRLDGAIRMQPR